MGRQVSRRIRADYQSTTRRFPAFFICWPRQQRSVDTFQSAR